MENAGRAAASIVHRLRPTGSVVALAGSGNNGGDAVVVARTLSAWGRDVTLLQAGSRDPDPALFHGWPLPLLDPSDAAARQALASADVVIDGLLGTGIEGAPRGPVADLIDRVNEAAAFVCSLDVPSGVGGIGGSVPGTAVRADVTVSFGGAKLGALLHPGRGFAGRVVAVEIGFPPIATSDCRQWLFTPGWADAHRPKRPPVTHKNAVGRRHDRRRVTRNGRRCGLGRPRGAACGCGARAHRVGRRESPVGPVSRFPRPYSWTGRDTGAVCDALDRGAGDPRGTGDGPRSGRPRPRSVTWWSKRGRGPLVVDADALTLLGQGRPMSADSPSG